MACSRALGIAGPVILVGHSMGGVYARAFAARHLDRVAGMVLVDSSHEGQWAVLPAHYSLKNRVLGVASGAADRLFSRRKWRGGADRWSMVREYLTFKRLTAADAPLAPGGLGERPLAVLTRGPEGPADSEASGRRGTACSANSQACRATAATSSPTARSTT